MNIFDILGPVMVGPSSSHTAGAVRIGRIARKLLKDTPVKAEITLAGSFAATGAGHGTDRALVAGLLGMKPDDPRIPESFAAAKDAGLSFTFGTANLKNAHPNTALVKAEGESGKKVSVQASSLGGGRIMVNKLDGVEVCFSGESPTLIVHNEDRPGCVADVAATLSQKSVNIATMQLCRDKRDGHAVMILETDDEVPEMTIRWLSELNGILRVSYINGEGE